MAGDERGDADKLRALETPAPDGADHWTIQGLVADRTLNADSLMARRMLVLEKEPGGQFLALHGEDGLDLTPFIGQWVEVEGSIWMESFTAIAIREIADPNA